MSVALAFRPPAPFAREKPLGRLGMVYTLWRNPLEIWTRAHFERPIVLGRTALGFRAVINEPAAVKRVLLDNAANYRKDDLQLRILDFAKTLSPAGVKGESLLCFEGSITNEDLNLMSQAIEEGCEQVDMSGW